MIAEIDIMLQTPVLSESQELAAFQLLRDSEGPQREAHRERIFRANIGLVLSAVKRFWGPDMEDLISTGYTALLRAVDAFDPDRGYRFSSYACRAINNALGNFVSAEYRWKAKHALRGERVNEEEEDDPAEETRGSWDEVRIALDNNEADLTPVEIVVLRRHYGIDCDQTTLSELARELGVSTEWPRRLRNRALGKLRQHLERKEGNRRD